MDEKTKALIAALQTTWATTREKNKPQKSEYDLPEPFGEFTANIADNKDFVITYHALLIFANFIHFTVLQWTDDNPDVRGWANQPLKRKHAFFAGVALNLAPWVISAAFDFVLRPIWFGASALGQSVAHSVGFAKNRASNARDKRAHQRNMSRTNAQNARLKRTVEMSKKTFENWSLMSGTKVNRKDYDALVYFLENGKFD